MALSGLTNKAIRSTVSTILIAAGTSAGGRVYLTPVSPLQEDDTFPIVRIYTGRTRDANRSLNMSTYTRTTTLELELHHRSTLSDDGAAARQSAEQALYDDLDDLADECLDALLSHATWPATWEMPPAPEVRVGAPEPDGQYLKGVAVISMDLQHDRRYTLTIADDFNTAQVNVDMVDPGDDGEPDGNYEASLTVAGLGA